MTPLFDRAQKLFIVLTGFFIANAILAELIGVKIFALEDTLGAAAVRVEPVRPDRLAELHRGHLAVAGGVRDDRRGERVFRPARRAL
jgi:hypothetical protein